MVARFQERSDIRGKLDARVDAGEMLLAFGAGTGLSAKIADASEVDLLAIYSTATMRMNGLPTLLAFLPYLNCNDETWAMAAKILPVVESVPCLAGIGAHDPRLDLDAAIERARAMGFSGTTNEPFVGIYGRDFAEQLEATGVGFSREVALIEKTARAGMFGFGWAFTPEEAARMADAGSEAVGAMVGATAGGLTGAAKVSSLDIATRDVEAMAEAARRVNPRALVFAHGGPFKDLDSVRFVFERTGCAGYASGSSGERMPTEIAIGQSISGFRSVRRNGR